MITVIEVVFERSLARICGRIGDGGTDQAVGGVVCITIL